MAKILVVDDDVITQKLVSKILTKHNHTVVCESDGLAALNRVTEDRSIDLVVTDVKMPKMDGRDFAMNVRNLPETAALPIIIMSGAVGPKFIADVLKDGVTAFIPKPISPNILIEYVDRYLDAPPIRHSDEDAEVPQQ